MEDCFPDTMGARVRLRALRVDDADTLQVYRSAPEVARYQSWDTDYSLDEAQNLTEAMASAAFGARGVWYQVGIVLLEEDQLIGDFGVYFDETDTTCVEIGYCLWQEVQGKGYATEALRLLIDLLVRTQGILSVKAVTDARNAPSRRLLRRLGFDEVQVFEKNGFYKGEWCDEVLYHWRASSNRQA
jgi:RimJ/RimL family protein N-acetyltransferase